jgi:hypothetical protein
MCLFQHRLVRLQPMLLCFSDVRRLLFCKRSVLSDEIFVGTNVLAYYTQMGKVVKRFPGQFGYFKVGAGFPAVPLLLHFLPAGQGSQQSVLVGILQVASHRKTARQARHPHAQGSQAWV